MVESRPLSRALSRALSFDASGRRFDSDGDNAVAVGNPYFVDNGRTNRYYFDDAKTKSYCTRGE